MRRFAFVLLLLFAALPPARARDATEGDCTPVTALIANGAEPVLLQVAHSAGSAHFVKNEATQAGCPDADASCSGEVFLVPGDLVVVTGETRGYACATFSRPPPGASVVSGWLPRAALAAPPPSTPAAARDWRGEWRSGPEQRIRILRVRNGRLGIHGEATFGRTDPDRVQRGAVNTGDFAATVPPAPGRLAFLVGDNGKPLAYDLRRAKAQVLCGLRLWRLGPYLVVADNLQCGGNGVTFTGVYCRVGPPA